MKFKVSVFFIILAALLSLTVGSSSAKVYVAEPYLVQQPPYAGMTFYVYRPYGLEKNWYLTFDGYAVAQDRGEIWVYGTMHGGKPVKTNYIVGSVNPAVIGLVPYSGANGTNTERQSGGMIISQPLGAAPNQVPRQIYVPEWSLDPAFLAISNWKKTVDRIGMWHKYDILLAWKGDRPEVIYAWTGKHWSQIITQDERVPKVLESNLYWLLKEKEKNYQWYAEDIPLLTEKTISWGYLWLGQVLMKNDLY